MVKEKKKDNYLCGSRREEAKISWHRSEVVFAEWSEPVERPQ